MVKLSRTEEVAASSPLTPMPLTPTLPENGGEGEGGGGEGAGGGGFFTMKKSSGL